MVTLPTSAKSCAPVTRVDSTNWHSIYCLLFPIVTIWVYSARIPTWFSQRDEIIAEIVQEAVVRTFHRLQRGKQGLLPPVESIKHLSVRIARNYYIDMIRRDSRFLYIERIGEEAPAYGMRATIQEAVDFMEVASENAYIASLFSILVAEILNFPPKLRTAILIDLANRMAFKGEPTLLQQAFLLAGIKLEDYCHQVPIDPVLRSRHMSLVSLAYRKIRGLVSVHEYIKFA
jgi:hypothetical protein